MFARQNWVIVACVLAAAACGKSSDDDDSSTGGGAGKTGGAGGTAGKGGSAGSGGKATGGAGGTNSGGGGTSGGTKPGTGGSSAGDAGSGTGAKGGSAGTPSGGHGGTVAGSGAQGDAGSDAGGEAGMGTESCTTQTLKSHGTRARSSGFAGTLDQYDSLYDLSCETQTDCNTPCLAAGGTTEMCAGTYCMMSSTNYCLPATIWTNLTAATIEGTDPIADGAQLVLWSDPYRDFLLVDDFNFDIPASATIKGITATVRRAGGGENEAADAGVHLIKGGVTGTLDKSKATTWGTDLEDVDYGGAADLWAESWTPADLNAEDFGVAVSAQYAQSAGNGRAYIDIVYVTVSYCE